MDDDSILQVGRGREKMKKIEDEEGRGRKEKSNTTVERYQYKPLAMLFSSVEKIYSWMQMHFP